MTTHLWICECGAICTADPAVVGKRTAICGDCDRILGPPDEIQGADDAR